MSNDVTDTPAMSYITPPNPKSWWRSLPSRLNPGSLTGVTLGTWLRILRENDFAIESPYLGRAAVVTLNSLPNTVLAWWEDLFHGPGIRATRVEPPLFVLGYWRSGTTHLHNLLARDDRFAFPNSYQVVFPLTFLTTEWLVARLVELVIPKTRPQDNVQFGVREPQEDELALSSLVGRSLMLSTSFPKRFKFYSRYRTLHDLDEAERAEWKAGLLALVKKLSYKYRRPLVLKSPGHMCRIKTLLEMFPEARFVHIHRNPYDVFQSIAKLSVQVSPWECFQTMDLTGAEDRILRAYREAYDTYFDERELIPKGRLVEVGYEQLEQDAIGELRGIYERLNLPDFSHIEPSLRAYVDSLAGYRKNQFSNLPPDLRDRIARDWRRCFDEWGYET